MTYPRKLLLANVIGAWLFLMVAGVLAMGLLSWRATERAANDIRQAVHDLSGQIRRRSHMQKMTTQVADTQGNVHTIETTRNAGESVADWQSRHMEAVNAAKAL